MENKTNNYPNHFKIIYEISSVRLLALILLTGFLETFPELPRKYNESILLSVQLRHNNTKNQVYALEGISCFLEERSRCQDYNVGWHIRQARTPHCQHGILTYFPRSACCRQPQKNPARRQTLVSTMIASTTFVVWGISIEDDIIPMATK